MARRNRKRFLSIIFVPDQDQDPKSISMSYGKGRFILVLLVVVSIHIVLGAIGYYSVLRLRSSNQVLKDKNQILTAQSMQIEKIMKEHVKNQMYIQRIKNGLGVTLGGMDDEINGFEDLDLSNIEIMETARSPLDTGLPVNGNVEQVQTRLTYLENTNEDYFDPDYLPTLLPVQGFLTTRFQKGGWYVGRSHYGIDLAARKGTPVRAAGSGIVLLADWTSDFGNVVVISHGGGFYSYYAHAQRVLVDQGDKVQKGQPIAYLGSSGPSSAPHLHFEIWKNGEPVDPTKILYAQPRGSGF
jgi:murein DD-endopeptidase MepM/ murein hydrolase activator NlpD